MVEFWGLIAAVGGVTLLGIVIGKYTGTLSVALDLMGKVFDAFMTAINWTFTESPKPIRIMLILIILGSVGGFVVNNTFGAQYVCLDNSVKKTSMLDGLVFKWWPENSALSSIDEGLEQNYSEDLSGNQNIDIPIYKFDELAYQDVVQTYESGSTKGIQALMTPGMAAIANEILLTRSAINPLDQFREIICYGGSCENTGTNIEYGAEIDICRYDGRNSDFEGTCVARLNYDEYTACDSPFSIFGSSNSDSEDDILFGSYTQRVGKIWYFYQGEDGDILPGLHVNVEDTPVFDFDFLQESFFDVGFNGLSSCEESNVVDTTFGSGTVSKEFLRFKYTDARLQGQAYNVPIYQLTYGPLMAIPTGQPYVDVIDEQRRLLVNSRMALLDSYTNESSALGGTIQFSCNVESVDNVYDVKMELFGIDILNPAVLALIAILGIILYIYRGWGILG